MNRRENRYQKMRKLGKFRFVLIVGILMWAMPVMVFVQIFEALIAAEKSVNSVAGFFDLLYPVKLIIWPIAGICFGLWMWRSTDPARRQAE